MIILMHSHNLFLIRCKRIINAYLKLLILIFCRNDYCKDLKMFLIIEFMVGISGKENIATFLSFLSQFDKFEMICMSNGI